MPSPPTRKGPRTDKILRTRTEDTKHEFRVACPRHAGGMNPLGAELRAKFSTRGARESKREERNS